MLQPESAERPLDGVAVWTNPGNRFRVVRVHYSADPTKREAAWRTQAQAGMPERGWRREMEIDFTAPEGESVIPEFDPTLHVVECAADRHSRLLRGWDAGYVSPAVLFAQLAPSGQLCILDECVPFNTPLDRLVPLVKSKTVQYQLNALPPFDAGDPAMAANQDLGQVKGILARDYGIFIRTSRPGTETSYQQLRERFTRSLTVPRVGHIPSLVIHPRCQILIAALSGAFHLSTHPPYRPVPEHPWKDVVDALRYLCDNLDHSNSEFQATLGAMAKSDWVRGFGQEIQR